MSKGFSLIAVLFLALGLFSLAPAYAANAAPDSSTVQASETQGMQSSEAVMQQFAGDIETSPERRIETERKHQILFMMGLSLLVLLLFTGAFGVAMVVFDKNVFVPHMIFAGLSLTLAAAHAATAIAWFWPY